MSELRNVENLANPWPAQQDNNERIESRLWGRSPSTLNGNYTTLLGSPTGGDWPLHKLWWDSLRAVFVCTTAGSPGDWRQLEPAIVIAFPSNSIPDKYWVIRSDLNFRQFYYDLAGTQWIEVGGAGGLDYKASCRLATTGNVDLATGGLLTVDTVLSVENDRIAVWQQTDPKENGIYLAKPGAWVRADDADTSSDFSPDMVIGIEEGATYADAILQLMTNAPIVLGTSDLVFRQVEFTAARVRATTLLGLNTVTTGAITAADTVLTALGKLQATKSAIGHVHSAADITSGVLTTNRGGLGIDTSGAAQGDILYYNGSWNRLARGANGQILKLAAGLPSWANESSGGSPAGADTQIQFNNAGAFGASSLLKWMNNWRGRKCLAVGGDAASGNNVAGYFKGDIVCDVDTSDPTPDCNYNSIWWSKDGVGKWAMICDPSTDDLIYNRVGTSSAFRLSYATARMSVFGDFEPASPLDVAGCIGTAIRTVSGEGDDMGYIYPSDSDSTILIIAAIEDLIISLPAASDCPRRIYFFKSTSDSTYNVDVGGIETLTPGQFTAIQSDGSNWNILFKI